MLQKIKDWILNNKYKTAQIITAVIMIILLVFFVVKAWEAHTTKPATTMPQQQAETPAGVEKAASNAHIKLDSGQTKQVSETIREIMVTEREPVYIIQTTGDKAREVSEKASKQEKADFSIVTDKDHSDEAVELDKLDENETVNLNQYNVQAYKKHINTIEYYPAEKTVGYTHQWKISKNGRYIGAGVDYNTDDQRVMAKITYSW